MNRHFTPHERKKNRQSTILLLFASIIFIGIGITLLVLPDLNRSVTPLDHENRLAASSPEITLDIAIPDDIPNIIKDYTGFTVGFNADNHTPNYCMWTLERHETGGPVTRTNKFLTDKDVDGCALNSDYTNSGFDRGHIVPAADQKWSEDAMNDCFFMTNICPQNQKLNRGAWQTLEEKERLWARRDSVLMIIAGPIYTPGDTQRIGQTGVRVPSAYFKVLVAPAVDQPRGIAFIYPNQHCPGNMRDYSCTIDHLELLTGYDFFPSLSPQLEEKIEAVTSFKEWNL